jgi:beta-lactamase regulating signal transducer with metallopeptidase domain
MPLIITYLIKLSVCLAVVFLFYQLVLRKLTFYNWNRWYLLGYTILSFYIPFINISPVLERNEWTNSEVITWVPVIVSSSTHSLSTWDMIVLFIAAGVLVMGVRLIIQLLSFRRMMKKATKVSEEGMTIYQVDDNIIPFSFGNSIFINRALHNETELQEIIRHEFVHVKQKHSVDIIWGELLCLLNWYNPFAWLLKKAIRQNLEFIADHQVLEHGVDKKQYQYLLLKVIGNNHFSIANQFNFSSLKKRIAMMNKMKSTKRNLVRFLFLLPVLAIILLSFREQLRSTATNDQPQELVQTIIPPAYTDTVPEQRHPNKKGYYIDVKNNEGNCLIVVKDKNRKEVKRLLMTEWNEQSDYYENLYGKVPPPPPPLPTEEQWKEAANPTVKSITVNNEKATVVLKTGKKEEYDLSDPKQKKSFEDKYDLPEPPSPPAAPTNLDELDAPLPPLPPQKAKGVKHPAPPVPPQPPKAPKKGSTTMLITADTLVWASGKGALTLKGNATLQSGPAGDISFSADAINLYNNPPLVLINGKEADLSKDFVAGKKSKMQVVNLDKNEAVKKYGTKGKNGAIEITTFSEAVRPKQPVQPSFLFNPYQYKTKEQKEKEKAGDGC